MVALNWRSVSEVAEDKTNVIVRIPTIGGYLYGVGVWDVDLGRHILHIRNVFSGYWDALKMYHWLAEWAYFAELEKHMVEG